MARLRFSDMTPHGGWRFLQPESRLVIEGESLGNLISLVQAHRAHKNLLPLDYESIRLEVERQICSRLGKAECQSEGTNDEWVPVPADSDVMNLEKIKSFSEAAWAWLKSGGEMVKPAEAERRAEICRLCPANMAPQKNCFNCSLGNLIRLAVPANRALPGLNTCNFCGCDLVSKVNVPASVIIASDKGRNIAYPKHCWQKEILDKNKADS